MGKRNTSHCHKNSDRKASAIFASNEHGAILVFAVVTMAVFIGIIALSIETGRLMIAARQLQNAADAAALAGVQRLFRCAQTSDNTVPLNSTCSNGGQSYGGWQAVKPAVIVAIKSAEILHKPLGTVTFTTNQTNCDLDVANAGTDWGDLRYSTATGTDLTVTVSREFECSSSGTTQFVNIDDQSVNVGSAFPYCLANAVRVTLQYSGVKLVLGRFLGIIGSPSKTIIRSAIATTAQNDTCTAKSACTDISTKSCTPVCASTYYHT